MKKIVMIALLILYSNAVYSALYKCNVNGSIEYSDKKCASDATNLMEDVEAAQREEDEAIGKGKWTEREDTSAIDDSKNVFLSLSAESSVTASYKSSTPTLYIRCAEKKLSVFINVGIYLGMGSTPVLVRYDSQQAHTEDWSISTDYQTIFAPGSYRYMSFVNRLLKHTKMLVNLTPYGERPIQFIFDLRGLRNVVSSIKQQCS